MSATTSDVRAAGAAGSSGARRRAGGRDLRSKRFLVLLVIVAVVGVVVSLAAWCFLEAIHQIQQRAVHAPPERTRATRVGRRCGGRCRCSRWRVSSSPRSSSGCPGTAATSPAKGLAVGGAALPDRSTRRDPGRTGRRLASARARARGPADRARLGRRAADRPARPRASRGGHRDGGVAALYNSGARTLESTDPTVRGCIRARGACVVARLDDRRATPMMRRCRRRRLWLLSDIVADYGWLR